MTLEHIDAQRHRLTLVDIALAEERAAWDRVRYLRAQRLVGSPDYAGALAKAHACTAVTGARIATFLECREPAAIPINRSRMEAVR